MPLDHHPLLLFISMSISLDVTEKSGSIIISLSGRLDSQGSNILKKELEDPCEKAQGNVIINMENGSFMSSAGIGVTVKALTTLKSKGFDLRLAKVSDEIKKIYDMLGFSSAIRFYSDVNAATQA